MICSGDEVFHLLLKQATINVNCHGPSATPVLHAVARTGKLNALMALLEKSETDINVEAESSGYTALHHAAKEGHLTVCSALIDKGADCSRVTKKGFTPLHLAVKYNRLAELEYLVTTAKCDVNAKALGGLTALHIAAHYSHIDVVSRLLECGADLTIAASRTGHTALHVATRQGNRQITQMLLKHGASTSATTKQGFTPLHLAAFAGSLELTKLLIDSGADLDSKAKNGLAPIHLAAQTGSVNVLSHLLDQPCDLGQTKSGCNVVHVSAHHGNVEVFEALINSSAISLESINTTNNAGMTPLHHAAQQGHAKIYQMLVDAGADQKVQTKNGYTPIDIAHRLGYVSIIENNQNQMPKSDSGNLSSKIVVPETLLESLATDLKQLSEDEDEYGENNNFSSKFRLYSIN